MLLRHIDEFFFSFDRGSQEPDFASLSLFQKLAMTACFFENWLVPAVDKEFGKDGVDIIIAMWEDSDADLFSSLQTAVLSRVDAASYSMMSLSLLDPLAKVLHQKLRPASGGLVRTAEASLSQQWEKFKEDIQKDHEYFNRCVEAKAKLDKMSWLDKLRQVHTTTSVGQGATDAFLKEKMCVLEAAKLSLAGMTVSEFLNGSHGEETHPTMHSETAGVTGVKLGT